MIFFYLNEGYRSVKNWRGRHLSKWAFENKIQVMLIEASHLQFCNESALFTTKNGWKVC